MNESVERKIYHDITLRLVPGQNMPQRRNRGGIKITPAPMRVLVVDEPKAGGEVCEISMGQWQQIKADAESSGLISYLFNGIADPESVAIAKLTADLSAAVAKAEEYKRAAAQASDEIERLRAAQGEEARRYRDEFNNVDGERQRLAGKVAELQAELGRLNLKSGKRG